MIDLCGYIYILYIPTYSRYCCWGYSCACFWISCCDVANVETSHSHNSRKVNTRSRTTAENYTLERQQWMKPLRTPIVLKPAFWEPQTQLLQGRSSFSHHTESDPPPQFSGPWDGTAEIIEAGSPPIDSLFGLDNPYSRRFCRGFCFTLSGSRYRHRTNIIHASVIMLILHTR